MSKRFSCLKHRKRGAVRLLCFPHAGGTPFAYYSWPDYLPETVEVWVAQLAARAARVNEPPHRTVDAIVADCLSGLPDIVSTQFALFGHSLGAIVSFELARALAATGRQARALFVSASTPPHRKSSASLQVKSISDDELLERLRKLHGTPLQALDEPELMRMVLPGVRADFEAADAYTPPSGDPLKTNIVAIGGADDPSVSPEVLGEWKAYTQASFSLNVLPGDHFYINQNPSQVCHIVASQLRLRRETDAYLR